MVACMHIIGMGGDQNNISLPTILHLAYLFSWLIYLASLYYRLLIHGYILLMLVRHFILWILVSLENNKKLIFNPLSLYLVFPCCVCVHMHVCAYISLLFLYGIGA